MPQELDGQDMKEIKCMIDVNLTGNFHLIKAALPGMKRSRAERGPGSVPLMSSQAGQVGIYGYAAYSASNFGFKGLAEALQYEIITDSIHVSLSSLQTPTLLVLQKRTKEDLKSPISSSSGAMKAGEVAQKSLDGIQSDVWKNRAFDFCYLVVIRVDPNDIHDDRLDRARY